MVKKIQIVTIINLLLIPIGTGLVLLARLNVFKSQICSDTLSLNANTNSCLTNQNAIDLSLLGIVLFILGLTIITYGAVTILLQYRARHIKKNNRLPYKASTLIGSVLIVAFVLVAVLTAPANVFRVIEEYFYTQTYDYKEAEDESELPVEEYIDLEAPAEGGANPT